jgi:hypothetical protein
MALCAAAASTATAIASGRLSASTARPRGPSASTSLRYFVGAFPRAVAARRRRRAAPAPAAARAGITVRAEAKKSVLIVNTNGGGHAVIGFYFAKELLAAGHAVTVLTVGDEGSDKMKKPPFSRFSVRILYNLCRRVASVPCSVCCTALGAGGWFRSWGAFDRLDWIGLFVRGSGADERWREDGVG